MTRDEAMTPVELTPLEDAIATAIYDYQRSVGLDDEAAGEDAFGIMRAVHTVIQQAFAERDGEIERLREAAGFTEQVVCNYCAAQVMLMGSGFIDQVSAALDRAGAPKDLGLMERIQALAAKGDSRG